MKVVCLICKKQGITAELVSPVIGLTKVDRLRNIAPVLAKHLQSNHMDLIKEIEISMMKLGTFRTLNLFEDPETDEVEQSEFELEKEELREKLMETVMDNAPDYDDDEEDLELEEGEDDEEDEDLFEDEEEEDDDELEEELEVAKANDK